ncbi:MAG: hypothetical protein IKV76_09935 [Clostridia bacterium]|nr:hypothetical protein [Clostridia bacterium]
MFTVIICDKKIIKDCEESYSMFLSPLMHGDWAFCPWNTEGTTPEEIFPDLINQVKNIPEWRAVIVLSAEAYGNGRVATRNPYHYNGFLNKRALPEDVNELKAYREQKLAAYEAAATNPLLRLANWLCGPAIKDDTVVMDDEVAALAESMPEDYFDRLKVLGVDPYSVESDICQDAKYKLLSAMWKDDSVSFNLPKQVVCIGERNYDTTREDAKDAWRPRDEFAYSDFTEPNMYPAKLRYLLYDIDYCNGERKTDDYINFLSFLLIFASNEYNQDAIKAYRIYKIRCEKDPDKLSDALSVFDTKLARTQGALNRRIRELEQIVHGTVSEARMDNLFLADERVNVRKFEEVSTDKITVSDDFVQIATDVPGSESATWFGKTALSKKAFVKFLKEPRRAVSRAAEATRKEVEYDPNDSEDVFYMTEFQREDIEEKIRFDEQSMANIVTSNIYDTESYKKRLDSEKRRVASHIDKRMTLKVIGITTGVGVGAYFAGYLPLFFSSLNSGESFLFSVVVALIASGLVLLAAAIALFIFRYMLKKDVRNYNIAVEHMIAELRQMMDTFGKYLGHFKGYMRRKALLDKLNHRDKAETLECRILRKHIRDIEDVRSTNRMIFREYRIFDNIGDIRPYNYNFQLPEKYEYGFPHEEIGSRKIVFIQPDTIIDIPVDFVSGITISREEFYDE